MIHKPDFMSHILHESVHGLYYHDTSHESLPDGQHGTILINMDVNNVNQYWNADYAQAVLAHKIQKIIS